MLGHVTSYIYNYIHKHAHCTTLLKINKNKLIFRHCQNSSIYWALGDWQGWARVLFRSERSVLSRSFKECSVLFSSFWRLMRPKRTFLSFPFFSKEGKRTQRTQRSFAKNRKERKERNVLLQRMEKNARTFCSFAKEGENLPFFFP